eukprot:348387-Prymnesium_polylepis.1
MQRSSVRFPRRSRRIFPHCMSLTCVSRPCFVLLVHVMCAACVSPTRQGIRVGLPRWDTVLPACR